MVSARRKVIDPRRFHNTGQLLADQYYHVYNARLKDARESLIQNARFRWGPDIKHLPIEQLNGSLGSQEVFVIGTLFKHMPKQPSILRELEENIKINLDPDSNFTSDEDTLVLHETDENVDVIGDISAHEHVTGIPVALRGYQTNGGAKFHVTDVCYAGLNLSVCLSQQATTTNGHKRSGSRILLCSGLEFGFDSRMDKERADEIVIALKKLRDYILNNAASPSGAGDDVISRVIIAGNSVAPGYIKAKAELMGGSQSKIDSKTLVEVVNTFDKFLFVLAQSGVQLDVMPGKHDPTSFLLPQQPFHPRILPQSGALENVHPRTNPFVLEYDDRIILGTSGENVEAIRQHSRISFSTTILKNTLEWGHIAPSAPDNVSCLPFKESDPFLVDFTPDIYFAGNQPEYAVTTYKTETKPKIQIISVPRFVDSMSAVSVNLDNLKVDLVDFREL